jgi:endonuclease-3
MHWAVRRILTALRKSYGPRPWKRWGSGLDLLVETILSQNTSDANSSAGFRRLRRRFRSWNQLANAGVEEVEKCIRISGLSRIKAPRIQEILRQIKRQRGRIDLEFLARMRASEARQYLLRFRGVGPKTADCVLMFAFGMKVFPVDTHIHRIAKRLELIPPDASAERAHDVLEPMIRPRDRYEMHVLLIEHGRRTCRARSPRCRDCVLVGMCPYGKRRV